MWLLEIGMDAGEALDPSTIHAFLGTHFETNLKTRVWATDVRPISYAAIVIGSGLYEEVWGYGYGTFEDFGRAAALNHAAEFRRPGQKLVAHGIGLLSHVGPTGTVHAAIPNGLRSDGKTPYDGIEALAPIALDIKAHRTDLIAANRRNGPIEVRKALATAAGVPWEHALRARPSFAIYLDVHPRNYIIGRSDSIDPPLHTSWEA